MVNKEANDGGRGFSIENGTTYQKIQIPKEDSLLILGLSFASLERTNVATLDRGCFPSNSQVFYWMVTKLAIYLASKFK